MIEDREIDKDDLLIKVELDGGGGFMKVCLSIFGLEKVDEVKRLGDKFKNSGAK